MAKDFNDELDYNKHLGYAYYIFFERKTISTSLPFFAHRCSQHHRSIMFWKTRGASFWCAQSAGPFTNSHTPSYPWHAKAFCVKPQQI